MYGETDVFKREHADKLISDGTLKSSKVLTILNSGHHAYIDNTKGVVEALLNSYFEHDSMKWIKIKEINFFSQIQKLWEIFAHNT
mgnify:CR=1 FL=1